MDTSNAGLRALAKAAVDTAYYKLCLEDAVLTALQAVRAELESTYDSFAEHHRATEAEVESLRKTINQMHQETATTEAELRDQLTINKELAERNGMDVLALRPKLERLRHIGTQMSNVCFNLSQHVGRPLSQHDADLMKHLQVDWDAALASHPEEARLTT